MNFDPSITIKSRSGEPMKVDGKDMTVGWLALFALDNINLDKCDGKEMRRRFRLSTEIQAGLDAGSPVELKSDEMELVDELACAAAKKLVNGGLIYGQFDRSVSEMKEAAKAKPNGANEARAEA